MLQIYTSSGILEKEVIMDFQDDFFDGDRFKKNPTIYYTLIKASDKYIYALCQNQQSSQFVNNIPKIEVWDWDGNPVAEFTLDKSICAFDVYEDKVFYGMDYSSMDCIFRYDFPGLIDK